MFKSFLIGLCLSFIASIPASAFVVGGDVTGGKAGDRGGMFIQLDPATGFSVGHDNFDKAHLYAFDELQNAASASVLSVDIGIDVAVGQKFSSHYVFFDAFRRGTTQTSYVDFSAPILGVATSEANLALSDVFSNPAVQYVSGGSRGLESGDIISIDASMSNRLNLNWLSSSPGDYVRVFTLAETTTNPTPIPLPASWLLMVAAFGGLNVLRKKSES